MKINWNHIDYETPDFTRELFCSGHDEPFFSYIPFDINRKEYAGGSHMPWWVYARDILNKINPPTPNERNKYIANKKLYEFLGEIKKFTKIKNKMKDNCQIVADAREKEKAFTDEEIESFKRILIYLADFEISLFMVESKIAKEMEIINE